MSRIDTSKITGFEEMSVEEKLAAVMGIDIPDPVDLTQYVPKATADKYASEAAEYKKQLKAKMTDDEQAAATAKAEREELEANYAELLKKTTIAEHTAKFLALKGYDEKLAKETAEALFAGDMEKVFENQQKANNTYEQSIKAELLKQTPLPGSSNATNAAITKKQFNDMSYTDRVKLFNENRELYDQLNNDNNGGNE